MGTSSISMSSKHDWLNLPASGSGRVACVPLAASDAIALDVMRFRRLASGGASWIHMWNFQRSAPGGLCRYLSFVGCFDRRQYVGLRVLSRCRANRVKTEFFRMAVELSGVSRRNKDCGFPLSQLDTKRDDVEPEREGELGT